MRFYTMISHLLIVYVLIMIRIHIVKIYGCDLSKEERE